MKVVKITKKDKYTDKALKRATILDLYKGSKNFNIKDLNQIEKIEDLNLTNFFYF